MRRIAIPAVMVLALAFGACRNSMSRQPRSDPFEESPFFPDGVASRNLPSHVVSREHGDRPEWYDTGIRNGVLVDELPFPLTRAVLERGRERFDIYCSVCHDRTGQGTGMVVRRGFPNPPSYHTDRLRRAPIGYFVHVMHDGFGVMYPYASRVGADDRWAIAAYIRTLQLSRHADLTHLSAADRDSLMGGRP